MVVIPKNMTNSLLGSGAAAADFLIVSIQTNNPDNIYKEYATSNHQWAVRYRDYAKKAYGIGFTGPPPPPLNEKIVDWHEQTT